MACLWRVAHGRHAEKLRFLVVGGWNTAFSVFVIWLLDRSIPYDPASILEKQAVLLVGWIISITHNFFTFKMLVFRTQGNWLREYARMYITYAATFVLQSLLVQAITQAFDCSIFWANLPTVFVVAVLSYLGHRHFTFRSPSEP